MKYKPCPHCNYTRKRQRVKNSRCPKCGYQPVSFLYKLRMAVRGLKTKPYQPSHKIKIFTDSEYEPIVPVNKEV